jgi:hypothetical protein
VLSEGKCLRSLNIESLDKVFVHSVRDSVVWLLIVEVQFLLIGQAREIAVLIDDPLGVVLFQEYGLFRKLHWGNVRPLLYRERTIDDGN